MTIAFNHVIPFPLKESDLSASEVWQNSFLLDKTGNYLVNASSGKGKSTLVNLIYGLRHDYLGEITFDHHIISSLGMDEWADLRKSKISIVFQNLELLATLSVKDNIRLKNELTDFKTESEILQMLQALGMEHFFHEHVGNLSMGQQQRVAIVRGLCQPFKWFLLDEPFSHLDSGNAELAWRLISEEVYRQKASTLITTLGSNHQIDAVKTLML